MLKALEGLDGIRRAEMEKKTGTIRVTREPGKPGDEKILQVIREKAQIESRRLK